MFFFSGRDEAATPTPSLNNVETVSFDEEGNTAVKLGYHYKGTAEQIQEEKRKNALYEGAADKGKGEFHYDRSAPWERRKPCQLGFSIVGSLRIAYRLVSRAKYDHRFESECIGSRDSIRLSGAKAPKSGQRNRRLQSNSHRSFHALSLSFYFMRWR